MFRKNSPRVDPQTPSRARQFESSKEITIIGGVPGVFSPKLGFVAGFATLTSLVGLGWVAAAVRSPSVTPPSLNLHMPPTRPEAWSSWVITVAEREEARDLLLDTGDEFLAVPRGKLGYRVDRPALLDLLSRSSQPLPWLHKLRREVSALGGSTPLPVELPLPWRFDEASARVALQELAAQVFSAPRDARLDFARRQRHVDVPGRRLDVEATLSELTASVRRMNTGPVNVVAQLHFEELPAAVTRDDLLPVDPTKLLAHFDTDFSKKRGPRIHNIRRAASYLDGTVLLPGATFSFNQRVGKRVASRGFIDAPVIVNDEMESGMGGGVCQVATTLHAAAVYGALEVTERRSHSRPSGYAPLGLDATVLDGVQDLKLENPYSVPLYIRAYLPSRYVVRVEIFGAELDGPVKHSYWVTERHAFTRRVVEKPDLAPGTFKFSQKGNFGYDTVSSVISTNGEGQRRERRYKSKYYPVPEVLWVGPGTRPGDLPPLPEAALAPEAEQTL